MVSDSQSMCGAQRRRVKFFWRVVVVLVCAVVGFFVFSFYALLHDDGLPSMDGRLPLEKRVSIEAFQRDVEPHILSARQALFEDTGGVRPFSEGSRISTAVGESWTLYSQNTDGAKVSVDAVYEVMRDYVEPQGYVLALDSVSKDGRHVFVWRDYDNGGTVDVNINGDWTSFVYESGARPSDGSVPDPRVLIPNDSRDIAGYVSDSLPSIWDFDRDAPRFPETDGSEWAEKRQSIEVFQREVEPGILSFRDEIVGDSPYYVAPSPSEMETRNSYPPPEYWLESQRVKCGPRDVGQVIEMGNARLNPLGYVLVYDYASPVPGVGHYLAWKDEKNGGIVTVILREKNTEFSYKIGARPSDGSVPDPTVLIPNDHRDLPDPLA